MPPVPKNARNILIRSTNWIGDAIMTTPAVRSIRRNFPDAKITLLALPWVADVFRACPHIDHIFIYDKQGRHQGLRGKIRLAADLRKENYDLTILLQNAFEAALIQAETAGLSAVGYVIAGAPHQDPAGSVDDLLYLARADSGQQVLSREVVDLVRDYGLSRLGAFTYSPEEGTPGFELEGAVALDVEPHVAGARRRHHGHGQPQFGYRQRPDGDAVQQRHQRSYGSNDDHDPGRSSFCQLHCLRGGRQHR